jgi:SAM-dependent methyltransferase
MSAFAEKLEAFVLRCAETSYAESPENIAFHASIFKRVWDDVKPHLEPLAGKTVLDVGCANGFALRMFLSEGMSPVGVTCNIKDVDVDLRNSVFCADMHNMGETIESHYDLVWARHVCEHSPIPLFLLNQFKEKMKFNGFLYVEVPSPSTLKETVTLGHSANPNHYSCFSREGWDGLFLKAGLAVVKSWDVNVTVPAGEDVYFSYLLKKAPTVGTMAIMRYGV